MNSFQTRTVGEIAASYPLATRVFARHEIDFCCGGGKSIQQACEKAGIDVEKLQSEIEAEAASQNAGRDVVWAEQPLDALIEHILVTHHRPMDTEFERLEQMARKVYAVHRDKDPERLASILQTYQALRSELEVHFQKEEQILFPWIRSGRGASAGPPIRVMLMEHDSAAAMLAQLRELTDGYTVPAQACGTWRALWEGLEALEADLKQHIHQSRIVAMSFCEPRS